MFAADLHIHSKYARATSKDCVPECLDMWAGKKGLDLIGTGDLTHPIWRQELREKLKPAEDGLYVLKEEYRLPEAQKYRQTRFVMTGEISSIYKKNGKVRKVHNVVIFPSMEAADRLSQKLESIGANIHSDGRPIIGLDSRDLLEMTLESDEKAIFIPAHIWTPHFSLFGAYSGFDTIEECFEDMTPYIHALETGLSSDPTMNWRVSALDKYILVSNSDAHSPGNLAREANVFNTELSYRQIYEALENKNTDKFYGTLEFFPEEGKYHFDGHRKCGLSLKPSDTINNEGICPVCGGRITVGVLHRVEALADRQEGHTPNGSKAFERIVPLTEVIASAMNCSSSSVKVKREYERLISDIGSELYILRNASFDEINEKAGILIAEGIKNLRNNNVETIPGYDGEYGKVNVISQKDRDRIFGQIKLFDDESSITVKNKNSDVKKILHTIKEEKPTEINEENYGLNEEQWNAASSTDRAVEVIAGPGTGKTKTLVSRVAFLIEKMNIDPSDITAVTFTNKAAKEMKERLEKHFNVKSTAKKINIGTFHSLCIKNFKDVNIIDEAESLDIAEEIIKETEIPLSPKKFLGCVSMIKNGAGSDELNETAFNMYQNRLKERRFIDFDDILLESLDKDRKCKHLLIDEFQDINDLQFRLIKKWGESAESIFVIGDQNQAIYGFRGADDKCFEKFENEFAPVKRIKLVKNYRSSPEIISCSASILINEENVPKAVGKPALPPRIVLSESSFTEGIFIAKEIAHMVGGINMTDTDGGRKHGKRETTIRGFGDIAVLYRTNRQAALIEECLEKEGIPYKVVGKDDLLNKKNVREAVKLLRSVNTKGKPSNVILEYMSENNLIEDIDMQKLYNMAVMYKNVGDFMQAVLIGQEADIVRSGNKEYNPDSVTLMTLHASKGLEFPVVFIAGAKEGFIPYQGFNNVGNADEERRLLYVGMTRAEEELLIITGKYPSGFVGEIPKETATTEKANEYKSGKSVQLSLFD